MAKFWFSDDFVSKISRRRERVEFSCCLNRIELVKFNPANSISGETKKEILKQKDKHGDRQRKKRRDLVNEDGGVKKWKIKKYA